MEEAQKSCGECEECLEGIRCREITRLEVSLSELHDALASRDFSDICERGSEFPEMPVVLDSTGRVVDRVWTTRLQGLLGLISAYDIKFHDAYDCC